MKNEWDRRYREGFYSGSLSPHFLIERFYGIVEPDFVLDLASGLGRDSEYLLKKGFRVVCLDISLLALKKTKENFESLNLSNFFLVCADAESLPFKHEVFCGIMVFYFLSRKAFLEIKRTLKRSGVLIYETFLKRQNLVDRWRNPEYLLDDGELLRTFQDFELIFYEEGLMRIDGKLKAIARYVGRKE